MSEILFILIIIALFLMGLVVLFNNVVIVRRHRITTDKFSKPFRIVFLADLLLNDSEKKLQKIVHKTKLLNPDIIIVSGECAKNTAHGKSCLKNLGAFSDVYICDAPFADGVCQTVEVGEYKIMNGYSILLSDDADALSAFSKLENFKIALLPRPSDFGLSVCAKKYDADLFLSWHSHGAVVRLPFFGAIYTKEDGFLPKYYSGKTVENGKTLIVTSGVGKSSLGFRLNNFKEIVCVDAEI